MIVSLLLVHVAEILILPVAILVATISVSS